MGRVEKSVEINAPLEECYRYLTHFESYPKFISNIESVRRKGDQSVWQWRIKGPQGKILTWDLEVMGLRHRNNIISWQTIRDADIAHSGAVTLEPMGDNKTCLNFVIQYNEGVGSLEELESLEPNFLDNIVQQGLQDFKKAMEQKPAVLTGLREKTPDKNTEITPDSLPYSI